MSSRIREITARIDKVASKLEGLGCVAEAEQLDVVANTLEAAYVDWRGKSRELGPADKRSPVNMELHSVTTGKKKGFPGQEIMAVLKKYGITPLDRKTKRPISVFPPNYVGEEVLPVVLKDLPAGAQKDDYVLRIYGMSDDGQMWEASATVEMADVGDTFEETGKVLNQLQEEREFDTV